MLEGTNVSICDQGEINGWHLFMIQGELKKINVRHLFIRKELLEFHSSIFIFFTMDIHYQHTNILLLYLQNFNGSYSSTNWNLISIYYSN